MKIDSSPILRKPGGATSHSLLPDAGLVMCAIPCYLGYVMYAGFKDFPAPGDDVSNLQTVPPPYQRNLCPGALNDDPRGFVDVHEPMIPPIGTAGGYAHYWCDRPEMHVICVYSQQSLRKATQELDYVVILSAQARLYDHLFSAGNICTSHCCSMNPFKQETTSSFAACNHVVEAVAHLFFAYPNPKKTTRSAAAIASGSRQRASKVRLAARS